MNDIKLMWKNISSDFGADCLVSLGDLAGEKDLTTAIILSLMLDARAKEDDILPSNSTDRRGWWGDCVFPEAQDFTGSRLWLLSREKTLPEVLRRAKEYAEQALQWLLEDKVAKKIEVIATMPQVGTLLLEIFITLPTGNLSTFKIQRNI